MAKDKAQLEDGLEVAGSEVEVTETKAKRVPTEEELASMNGAIASLSATGLVSPKMAKVMELVPNWHDTEANKETKDAVQEYFGGSEEFKNYIDGEFQEELVSFGGFAKLATTLNNIKSFYARRAGKRPSKATTTINIGGDIYSVNKAYLESLANEEVAQKRELLLAHKDTKKNEIESL